LRLDQSSSFTSVVPEPGSIGVIAAGMVGMLARRGRRTQA